MRRVQRAAEGSEGKRGFEKGFQIRGVASKVPERLQRVLEGCINRRTGFNRVRGFYSIFEGSSFRPQEGVHEIRFFNGPEREFRGFTPFERVSTCCRSTIWSSEIKASSRAG